MSAQEEWRSNPNVSEGIAEAWLFLGGPKHVLGALDSATSLNSVERPPLLRTIEVVMYITTNPLCVWVSENEQLKTSQIQICIYIYHLDCKTPHATPPSSLFARIILRRLVYAIARNAARPNGDEM